MSYNRNSKNNRHYPEKKQASYKKTYEPLKEEDYVTRAENVIKNLSKNRLTTSQIRNILSMMNEIYNEVIMTNDDKLSESVQSKLRYLKVKIIYAAGRNSDVKTFVEDSQIDQHLDHIGDSREKFILYSHYMEALVAYHRFYGGRD